jgi:UDP-4-amino-4,6-dideoxy-N-acetyl-beta-L-altrosamine N-acetyltransferase
MAMKKKPDYGVIGVKVFLKVLEEKDLESVFRWKNNVELARLVKAHPLPVALYEMGDWFKRNQSDKNQILWGIYDNHSSKLLGIVRLMFINWISKNAEFGIFIGEKNNTGKGIGKEALGLVLNYAFNDINLHRVHLKVNESNTTAIRLYTACGFKKEGVFREHFYMNGKYENVLLMGLLKKEYGK